MSTTPPSSPAGIESWEVLDLLTALVRKSLAVYEEDEQGHGRYRLLEPMRQYARDRLLEAFAAAWAEGRRMSLAEAVAVALQKPADASA